MLEIACDENLLLKDAHDIAEVVHEGVEQNFPLVKHVTVHVNPYKERVECSEKENSESEEKVSGGQ